MSAYNGATTGRVRSDHELTPLQYLTIYLAFASFLSVIIWIVAFSASTRSGLHSACHVGSNYYEVAFYLLVSFCHTTRLGSIAMKIENLIKLRLCYSLPVHPVYSQPNTVESIPCQARPCHPKYQVFLLNKVLLPPAHMNISAL